MQAVYVAKTITGAGTTVLIDNSAYVASILIVCSVAGLTMQIQDRSTPPRVLVPQLAYLPPTDGKPNVLLEFYNQINGARMSGGVDAVCTATGTPHVDVWVSAAESDVP
jgi:hypothetical protein